MNSLNCQRKQQRENILKIIIYFIGNNFPGMCQAEEDGGGDGLNSKIVRCVTIGPPLRPHSLLVQPFHHRNAKFCVWLSVYLFAVLFLKQIAGEVLFSLQKCNKKSIMK